MRCPNRHERLVLALCAGLALAACSSSNSSPTTSQPSNLSYSASTATYTVGTGITDNTPTSSGGAVTSYSVTPALPVGLSLNTTTGVISGTPSAVAATGNYTITATNASGSTSATVTITVNPMDVNTLLGGNGSQSIAIIGGGTAEKLWIMDAYYHRNITSIAGEGADGTHVPRATGAHNWNYPDLHDTHAIVTTKEFKKVYTVNWFTYADTSYAIEFDPKTMKETRRCAVGHGGHHAALSPDDKYLYVANQYDTTVSVIDVATFTKVTDINVGAMAVYPTPTMYWDGVPINTPYIFVSVTGAPPVDNTTPAPSGVAPTNAVAVIDWHTNTLVKMIPIGTSIHGVNITPDGKEVWVAQPGGESSKNGVAGTGDFTVIDVNTLAITHRVKMGAGGVHIIFDRTNKYGFVTGGGKLYKIDRSNYSVVWSAQTETSGAHLGVTPDNKEVWTLNHGMNATRYPYLIGGLPPTGVQVFSTDDGHLITEMVTEAVSHEIQFVPRSALGVPSGSGSGSSGLTVYMNNCQVCHGINGVGSADVGAPALNGGQWLNQSAAVQTYITTGAPSQGMPAFGSILTSADLKAVSDYVASLTK